MSPDMQAVSAGK